MKTSTIGLLAAALTFTTVSTISADGNGAPQRAAANHFELAPVGAPKNTALPKFVVAPRPGGGKMWAQILESRRPVSGGRGLDIVHAPRPLTASKDPDLDRKWRANAEALWRAKSDSFQVAPVK